MVYYLIAYIAEVDTWGLQSEVRVTRLGELVCELNSLHLREPLLARVFIEARIETSSVHVSIRHLKSVDFALKCILVRTENF